MNIYVKNRDFGFWSAKPVTVQIVDWHKDEDEGYKEVLWCNHDGYFEEDLEQERIASDGTIHEWTMKGELCDKCNAWRQRGEEEWHDTPFEGVK